MILHKRSRRPRAVSVGALVAIGFTFGTAHAVAAQAVYEPFDYPAGTVMDGATASGTNLTGIYTSPTISGFEPIVASPGLTYGSLTGAPAAAGNRLSQTTGTTAGTAIVSVDDDIATGGGTTTFFSALFTFSDALNGNHLARVSLVDAGTGDAVTFGEAGVGVRAIRVEANTDATGGGIAPPAPTGRSPTGRPCCSSAATSTAPRPAPTRCTCSATTRPTPSRCRRTSPCRTRTPSSRTRCRRRRSTCRRSTRCIS